MTKEDLQLFRMQLLDDLKKIVLSAVQPEEKPEWLKSGEVRKMLKVSPGILQNLRISGKLKPVKIEGTWYYRISEKKDLFEKGGKP